MFKTPDKFNFPDFNSKGSQKSNLTPALTTQNFIYTHSNPQSLKFFPPTKACIFILIELLANTGQPRREQSAQPFQ
jgi:hypothetical protein